LISIYQDRIPCIKYSITEKIWCKWVGRPFKHGSISEVGWVAPGELIRGEFLDAPGHCCGGVGVSERWGSQWWGFSEWWEICWGGSGLGLQKNIFGFPAACYFFLVGNWRWVGNWMPCVLIIVMWSLLLVSCWLSVILCLFIVHYLLLIRYGFSASLLLIIYCWLVVVDCLLFPAYCWLFVTYIFDSVFSGTILILDYDYWLHVVLWYWLMFVCAFDWLIDWLIDWLTDWLIV